MVPVLIEILKERENRGRNTNAGVTLGLAYLIDAPTSTGKVEFCF